MPQSLLPASERLYFRRLQESDAEEFFLYRSADEVTRYQPWEPASLYEARDYICQNTQVPMNTQGQWVQLGFFRNSDDTLIGDCGIHFLREHVTQAEVGITVAPQWHKQGYGSEALVALIEFLFTDLNKHRVIASVDPVNLASVAMVEKVGMRKEAHHLRSYWFKGRWADDMIFAILHEEWQQRSA